MSWAGNVERNADQETSQPRQDGRGTARPRLNEKLAHWADATASLLSIARSLGIASLVLVAGYVLWGNRHALAAWLGDAQRLSGFGLSVERNQLTALPVATRPGETSRYILDPQQLESVQARAIWLRPILSGAVMLWVDDNPAGNNNLLQFFQWAGISIRLARTNDEAMREMGWQNFDVVISDVDRNTSGEGPGEQPLVRCPIHFFSLLQPLERGSSLEAQNASEMQRPAPGLVLAERMQTELRAAPPLVYFTSIGDVLVARCAELTTDNPFRLIHGVFGVLEQRRAAEFNRFRPPWAPQQPAQR